MPPAAPFKRMRLRYAGTCRTCGVLVAAGQPAVHYRLERRVECLPCFDRAADPAAGIAGPTPGMTPATVGTGVDTMDTAATGDATGADPGGADAAPTAGVGSGTAGASARREYQRRVDRRAERTRAAHPRLGGLILAVTGEPQSTRAWEQGAVGEQTLARSLDALVEYGARVLHDRRIPGGRANIDHLLIAPGGVFVIDAKRYKGRPQLRVGGGILRPRVQTLMVGRRDGTKLLVGVGRQVDLVTAALATTAQATAGGGVPAVRGMLCFVDADWPLLGGEFTVSGVQVLWPKRIAERVMMPHHLNATEIAAIHAALATHFPEA